MSDTQIIRDIARYSDTPAHRWSMVVDGETLIFHSPESHRTPEGQAFARSVGGDALPCRMGCCDREPDFDDED